MSTHDFIPKADTDFQTFMNQLSTGAAANQAALGLTDEDVTAIKGAAAAFSTAFSGHIEGHRQSHALTEVKTQVRGDGEVVARRLVKKINAAPGINNALRAQVGLPDHETTRAPSAPPATRPFMRIEATGHYTLTLNIVDEATPTHKAKPDDAHGCEIFIHVGDPAPADPSGFTSLARVTRATYVDIHAAADAGKTAYYISRWLDAKLEPGPWSDVAAAKIPV